MAKQRKALRVGDSLTLRHIAEVHAQLGKALGRDGDLVLDLGAIVEADVGGIQLLLAARRSAAEHGKQFSLTYPVEGALAAALVRGGFLADPAERSFWLKESHAS